MRFIEICQPAATMPAMENRTHDKFSHELLLTSEAAQLLRVRPQSMRRWSCYGIGPLQSVKVNGRLLWRRADINKLTNPGHETAD